MTTAWELGVALDVEEALCPFAWRVRAVLREQGDAGRNVRVADPAFGCLEDPAHRSGLREVVVGQERRADGAGRPVDHDVGEQLIQTEPSFDVAVAVTQ